MSRSLVDPVTLGGQRRLIDDCLIEVFKMTNDLAVERWSNELWDNVGKTSNVDES